LSKSAFATATCAVSGESKDWVAIGARECSYPRLKAFREPCDPRRILEPMAAAADRFVDVLRLRRPGKGSRRRIFRAMKLAALLPSISLHAMKLGVRWYS